MMEPSEGPTRPAADRTLELADLLSHSARRLRRGSTAQLAPLGLTVAQARVLRILAAEGRPLRMADIAERLEVVPRSVTTMVDGVEEAGLIVRSTDPGDRRSVLVSLTAGGHALLESLERARRATAEDVFGDLADDERAELARLLGALCRRPHGHTNMPGHTHTPGHTHMPGHAQTPGPAHEPGHMRGHGQTHEGEA